MGIAVKIPFPISNQRFDQEISSVVSDTLNKISSVSDRGEKVSDELSEDIRYLFSDLISDRFKENKKITEDSSERQKDKRLELLKEKIDHDIESYNGEGVAFLSLQHIDKKESKLKVNTIKKKDPVMISDSLPCPRCSLKRNGQSSNKPMTPLVDCYEGLIQKESCHECKWNLDPTLFVNKWNDFEQLVVRKFLLKTE